MRLERRRRCLAAALLGVLACVTGGARADTILYEQPAPATFAGAYRSDSPASFAVYDDFTLATTGTIGQVDWTGYVVAGDSVTNFQVSIYADDGAGLGEPER